MINPKMCPGNKQKRLLDKKKCLLRRLEKVLNNLTFFESNPMGDEKENSENNCFFKIAGADGNFVDPDFVNLRERLLKKLKKAVAKNLADTASFLQYDVENTALELEQRAIIASILAPVYEKSLNDLILQVNAATNSNKTFLAVKAAAPTPTLVKMETSPLVTSLPVSTQATRIISERECVHTPPPIAKVIPTVAVANPANTEIIKNQLLDKPISRVSPQFIVEADEFGVSEPLIEMENEDVEPGLTDFLCHMDQSPHGESHVKSSQVNDELELENLMKILEGDDEDDDHNPEEMPSEHIGNLNNRLQMMFGENDNEDEEDAESKYLAAKKKNALRKEIALWRNLRYIYLYKVFKSTKKMNAFRFYRVRRNFSSFFGDDSDFEHEDEFGDDEKFIECCVRRTSPSVVSFIRPYYQQKRINSTEPYIFKNLVTRIADSLVSTDYAPSDHQVRRQVDRFFPPGKKYMNLTDIWCFEP